MKIVVSGPGGHRDGVVGALEAAGCKVAEGDEDFGLPSHPTCEQATAAGAPNAGHTPGTTHPNITWTMAPKPKWFAKGTALPDTMHHDPNAEVEYASDDGELVRTPVAHQCAQVGQPYQADPSIAFVTCEGEHPDLAVEAVTPFGWQVRMHFIEAPQTASPLIVPDKDSYQALLERLDALESRQS